MQIIMELIGAIVIVGLLVWGAQRAINFISNAIEKNKEKRDE